MALRAEGTNILIKLDNKSLDAYILDAVIGRQRYVLENFPGSHIHYDQVYRFLIEKHPNLEVDKGIVVDRLRALSDEGKLKRTPTNGEPSYRFNSDYLDTKSG